VAGGRYHYPHLRGFRSEQQPGPAVVYTGHGAFMDGWRNNCPARLVDGEDLGEFQGDWAVVGVGGWRRKLQLKADTEAKRQVSWNDRGHNPGHQQRKSISNRPPKWN